MSSNRNSAIAAALIIAAVAGALLLMPTMVLWVGQYSPMLAAALGALVVSSFFLIFWLRARYQRQHPNRD